MKNGGEQTQDPETHLSFSLHPPPPAPPPQDALVGEQIPEKGSPEEPSAQKQVKDPGVFEQTAPGAHARGKTERHSSTSTQRPSPLGSGS